MVLIWVLAGISGCFPSYNFRTVSLITTLLLNEYEVYTHFRSEQLIFVTMLCCLILQTQWGNISILVPVATS